MRKRKRQEKNQTLLSLESALTLKRVLHVYGIVTIERDETFLL